MGAQVNQGGRGSYSFICPGAGLVGQAEITDETAAPWHSFKPRYRLVMWNVAGKKTYDRIFAQWENAERKVMRVGRRWACGR
jgi:hypothetical protein